MHLATGRAAWIWYPGKVLESRPVRFWATRDFTLPAQPARAMAKVFVDREHVLYVNGTRAGGGRQRPGDPLAVYDVAPLLVAGPNRVAIEAASPTGIGGVLFSMDVENFGRDALVSDAGWSVDLDESARERGARYRPMVWGPPPQYPWGYPRMPRPNELAGAPTLGFLNDEVEGLARRDAVRISAVVAGEGDDLSVGGDRGFQVAEASIVDFGQEKPRGEVSGRNFDGLAAEDECHVVALLRRRQAGTPIVEIRLARRIRLTRKEL